MKKIFWFVVIICLMSGCARPKGMPGKSPGADGSPVSVETLEIKTSNFTEYIEAVGTLESPQSTEVTAENKGKVVFLDIPEGSAVSKGHVIARIDDSTNLAEIKIAKAKLTNAKEDYERMKSLREQGAISQQVLDNALERMESAKGEVERVESIQQKTEINAPFEGILSFKNVSLGAFIDPGDAIVRISQINPLELIFSLPEKYSNSVKVGQYLTFSLSNESSEQKHNAKISVIDPYVATNTRALKIKATVKNENKALLPGRFSTIKLGLKTINNAILIPQEALIQEGGTTKVFVVQEDSSVNLKTVTAGEWLEDSIQIVEGLEKGNTIVTSGHQKLKPGVKIESKPHNKVQNDKLDLGLAPKNQ